MCLDADRGLERGDVDHLRGHVDAHVAGDARAMLGGEVHGDLGQGAEQIEVGGQGGHGPVEEQ